MEKLFEIIFEDGDLLVINKPAGLVCHPTKNGELSSLIGRARLYFSREDREVGEGGFTNEKHSQPSRDISELKIQNSKLKIIPHLINRLDRETSGVVLIAKNSGAAGELGKILESRAIEKEYLAIVHGHLREDHGLIDEPLGKDEKSIVAVKDCVRPDGTPSQTEFFVERRFVRLSTFDSQPSAFSLLRIFPRTGRKHQIRIHLAHLGHPVVGDKLYGGDEDCYLALAQNRLTEAQRAKLIFENHALHARSIKFLWRGETVEFSCKPEKWFAEFASADYAEGRRF